MLTNFHLPFHEVQIYLILFYTYYDFYMWFSIHFFSQPVHCLSAEIWSLSIHPILFLPRNHAFTIKTSASYLEPEDHWSGIAHLSAEDILKSAVIEEKKFKNIESEWFGPRSMNDLDLWYS